MAARMTFEIDGLRISYDRYEPEMPNGAGILVLHGYASTKANHVDRCERYRASGCTVVTVDFRGRGESEGAIETTTIDHDHEIACAAYDVLVRDVEAVYVFGSSYGGYHAMLLAQARTPSGLALNAPAIYPAKHHSMPLPSIVEEARAYRRAGSYDDSPGLRAIAAGERMLLVVEHELDESIPTSVIDAILQASKAYRYVVPGARHRIRDAAQRALVDAVIIASFDHVQNA